MNARTFAFHSFPNLQLTNVGEEQCYDLGKQLRERYLPTSNADEYTTTIEGLTLWYDADRVQVS